MCLRDGQAMYIVYRRPSSPGAEDRLVFRRTVLNSSSVKGSRRCDWREVLHGQTIEEVESMTTSDIQHAWVSRSHSSLPLMRRWTWRSTLVGQSHRQASSVSVVVRRFFAVGSATTSSSMKKFLFLLQGASANSPNEPNNSRQKRRLMRCKRKAAKARIQQHLQKTIDANTVVARLTGVAKAHNARVQYPCVLRYTLSAYSTATKATARTVR